MIGGGVSVVYYFISDFLGDRFSVVFSILFFMGFLVVSLVGGQGFLQGIGRLGYLRVVICLIFGGGFSLALSGVGVLAFLNMLPFALFYMAVLTINDRVFGRRVS